MQRQTVLSIWSERIIEAGWLLALALIPIYFNLLSARHFEPDKATTLRAIVLIMAAAGLVRVLEGFTNNPATSQAPAPLELAEPTNPLREFWQRFSRIPLAVPALVYALVFLVTTITSVVPLTSFWGSYQRLQGTYTNLSYMGLFVLILATLRRRTQLERLVTVVLLTGLTVAGYGLLQHFQADPLPWKGDVITRVASTMGNSIFVAAYMIMVVPLALYQLIGSLFAARVAPEPTDSRGDLLWALAYGFLVTGTLALLLMAIKFGAVVRTFDFRYWWIFPGAIVVATGFWVLPTAGIKRGEGAVPLWPGALFFGYLLLMSVTYLASWRVQTIDESNPRGLDWGLWLLISVVSIGLFYALALLLPRRDALPSRLAYWLQAGGAGIITSALLLATFFTQSRGPWIGLGAGLFTFFFLIFLQGQKHARLHDHQVLAGRLRAGLLSWLGLTLLAGVFLIVFNLSHAPFFEQLREVPYIGRMGRLLEVGEGTGRVRVLIWFGDEHADGVVGMIADNWRRTLVGWGPESMFVAYNKFYPPDLTSLEARGASPDRSHQALLDELATRGVLGLISYFFLLVSFFVFCWRLIRQSVTWHWQVFFIACFSMVICHFVEGLTGIPIVSTLMMFWVTLAMTVVGGMLAGQYALGTDQAPTVGTEQVDAPPVTTGTRTVAAHKSKKGRGGVTRGTVLGATRTSSQRRAVSAPFNPAAAIFYALLLLLTLMAVWWFNLSPIYADMRFQQGQAYTTQTGGRIEGQIQGMVAYLDSIHSNPREDFYYLSLGRTLMSISNSLVAEGQPLGTPDVPDDPVQTLLDLRADNEEETYTRLVSFLQQEDPASVLGYTEAVLERARELNEGNKDHYANLGRLNNFWYNLSQDPTHLERAVTWYQQAIQVAPQDVTLLNEYASVLAQQGSYAAQQGSPETAAQYYAQAEQLLQRSRQLDDRYTDTTLRMADLYRVRGNLAEATNLYLTVLEANPHALDTSINIIATSLSSAPEFLRQLRDAYAAQAGSDPLLHAIVGLLSVKMDDQQRALDAYAQAKALQPENLEYRRNYTIILSDTRHYAQALSEAQSTLELAQNQQASQQEVLQLEALIAFLQQRAAGGQ